MIKLAFSCSYNRSFDSSGCCRWSTNADEPLLFVKYDIIMLNILDVEKKTLTLTNEIQLDTSTKISC